MNFRVFVRIIFVHIIQKTVKKIKLYKWIYLIIFYGNRLTVFSECYIIKMGDFMKKYVSASILSADFLKLGKDLSRVEESGADMLHFDVMDGSFVNNISFGFPVLEAVRRRTDMILDVHLMIDAPLKYVRRFADAGADIITVHLESGDDAGQTLSAVRECGVKAGLAIKPKTNFESVIPYLAKMDMLLIMTVEPGFGGQSYISEMTDKIACAKKYISEHKLDIAIQVDGGINDQTSRTASEAGADIFVAGNYLFSATDMKIAVDKLKQYF